jgi:hypothetical protein
MTMHLIGPWLTTLGKKKGKQKFRNAEQAKKARELDDQWQKLLAKHGATDSKKSSKKSFTPISAPTLKVPENRSTKHIKSVDTGQRGAVNIKQAMQYTGDKIIGIGTMHKSNAVPIFSDKEAKDISSMRR